MRSSYRWYVLALLAIAYAFNFADRQILGILAQPIKTEMRLSDLEVGLLTGPSIAFFYALLTLPMGYLADRIDRVRFVAVCLTLWSVLTALGSAAANGLQLALSRVGVSAAESGALPASSSVIADYFEPRLRPVAMGVYGAASTVGLILCFALGGWVSHVWGWRMALIAAGLPGIPVAILLATTVREPVRGATDAIAPVRVGILLTFRTLWSTRIFRGSMLGGAAVSTVAFTINAWVPSMIMRRFALDAGSVGPLLGLAIGLTGGAAILLGGFIAARLARSGLRAPVLFCSRLGLFALPLFLGALFVPDYRLSIALVGLTYATLHLSVATQLAVVLASPAAMRGTAAAVPVLLGALFGSGLVPPIVGALSDGLTPRFGPDALRCALLIVPVLCLISSALFRWAAGGAAAEDAPG